MTPLLGFNKCARVFPFHNVHSLETYFAIWYSMIRDAGMLSQEIVVATYGWIAKFAQRSIFSFVCLRRMSRIISIVI